MAKLTETFINKAAKEVATSGKRMEFADDAQTGLRLAIGSRKSMWLLVCRTREGSVGRFRLGEYPGLNLSEARIKARKERERIRDGHNPIEAGREIRKERKRIKDSMTLGGLFERYSAEGANGRSWPICRRKVEAIFRSLLGKSLLKLTAQDIQLVLDTHPARKYAAWGMRQLRPMLKWGAASGRGYVGREVCDLELKVGVGKRERVLTDSELRLMLQFLNEKVGNGYYDCIRFLALTALRRSEAGNLTWDQVDFGEKVVRWKITKNGKPHTLPLSRQALALLEARKIVGNGDRVFHYNGGPLVSLPHFKTKVLAGDWQIRDLRRTAATLMGRLGYHSDVVEATLNHADIRSSIASVYNKSRYLPEVTKALQDMADLLDQIAGANVVAFPAKEIA